MALVVGATGLLGFEICRQLRAQGREVYALVRSQSSTSRLKALGVRLTVGDLKDRTSLEAACDGHDAVLSTANTVSHRQAGDSIASVDRDGHLQLVAAAQARHVRRFVFVSATPNLRATSPLMRAKREVEAAARASGLEWIILQPSAFMDVWLSPMMGWDVQRGKARVFGHGTTRCTYIAVADVAAFAVAALTRLGLANRDLAVGGPEAMSANEVVAICETITGRRFHVQHIPVVLLRGLSAIVRSFAPIPSSLMDMGAQTATRDDVIETRGLAEELGIPLTTVRQFVMRALHQASVAKSG